MANVSSFQLAPQAGPALRGVDEMARSIGQPYMSPLYGAPVSTIAQNVPPQPNPPASTAFDQALKQYPALSKLNLGYVYSPGASTNHLEFWPPGERGTAASPRPQAIPQGTPGVQVFDPKTRPIDVLGDVVSHYMVKTDPTIAGFYQNFAASLTPEQHQRIKEQYAYAQAHEGETRPFEQWYAQSGLPAYFRGYAFQQWPQEFIAKAYTPDQIKMFDKMMSYLGAK